MNAGDDCPFCRRASAPEDLLLDQPALVGFYDEFPVNEGHALLVPRKHLTSVDELFDRFGLSLVPALRDLCEIVQEKHRPDGFNIGFNVGPAAGQTIEHVHCHVIPRYEGDVEDPTGGIRGVIPDRQSY